MQTGSSRTFGSICSDVDGGRADIWQKVDPDVADALRARKNSFALKNVE